jgi:hypothetical protein
MDIEEAKGHCKSFTHEVVERVQGAGFREQVERANRS